jgi:hypothetical protein
MGVGLTNRLPVLHAIRPTIVIFRDASSTQGHLELGLGEDPEGILVPADVDFGLHTYVLDWGIAGAIVVSMLECWDLSAFILLDVQ